MVYIIEQFAKLNEDEDTKQLMKQIKQLDEISEDDYEKKIKEVINKVILHCRKKKSERILIPIDEQHNISITTATGLSKSWGTGAGNDFGSVNDIKTKVFNTNAINEICKYLTPEGVEEIKKMKTILNKYNINNEDRYADSRTEEKIKVKQKLPLTEEEKKFILPYINQNKFDLTIKYQYNRTAIIMGDDAYGNFDFKYDENDDDKRFLSLMMVEKYGKEINTALQLYMQKYKTHFPHRVACYDELKLEFAKYIMLELI